MSSEWIGTDKRLPDDGQHGLCALQSYNQTGGAFIVVPFTFMEGEFHPFADEDNLANDDYWHYALYWPSHWQPFPELPEL